MADGNFPDVLLHVDEASVGHPLSVKVRHVQPLAHRRAGPVDVPDPLLAPRRAFNGIVVAVEPALVLLHLHPPSRLQVLEGFAVELRPIGDASAQSTAVDEVKRIVEGPLGLCVVDVELAVGWHPCRLDGREIRADHHSRGELVCYFDGPDSGPSANVQDPLRGRLGDGSHVQRSVQHHLEDVVEEVEPILLFLIIREQISTVPKRVISSAVLVSVVIDGRANTLAPCGYIVAYRRVRLIRIMVKLSSTMLATTIPIRKQTN